MMTFKRIAPVTAAVVLAIAVGHAGPSSSSDLIPVAGSSVSGEKGFLTLWDDTNYKDRSLSRSGSDSTLKNNDFNDKASSYVNRTGSWWVLYDDTNFNDRGLCLRPRSHHWDLDKLGFNDKTSSLKRLSGGCTEGFPAVGVPN